MRNALLRTLLVALVLSVAPAVTLVQSDQAPAVVDDTVGFAIGTAHATVAEGTDTEVHRSATVAAPLPFSMIGFELPDGVDTLRVRTATDDGSWSEWYDLTRISTADGPDAGTEEAAADRSARFTEPAYTGEATRFQVEIPADEASAATTADGELDLEATVLDTEGLSADAGSAIRVGGATAEAAEYQPTFVTRSQWGAQAPRDTPTIGDDVDLVVVHHTAGSNNYTREQAAGQVRGIQNYHRNTLGWDDIGYNALIDKFGTIYEGRAGGLDRAVQGAHASGYNSGSFGVSVMGNYTDVDASVAAYESLANVIAWNASIHGYDPLGTTTRTRNGAFVRTVTGHQDVGNTSCPGLIQNKMWWIRTYAAERVTDDPVPAPWSPEPAPEPTPEPTPTPAPAPTPSTVDRFTDVPQDSPHRPSILELDAAGIINGYSDNTYRPANSLTRGQMATIFARAMGLSPKDPNGRFKDVTMSTSHAGNIMALVDAGVVNGYPDGTYRPGEPVHREQMATYLVNAKNLKPAGPTPYTDVPPSSAHYGSIGTAWRAGYVFGFANDTYLPGRDLRRDEAANMVARAFPQS